MIIEGAISVKSAIESKKRVINSVYIRQDKITKDFNYIRRLCGANNINLVEADETLLNSLTIGKTSGGVCADVTNRSEDTFDDGDIFYLDGIEDPFNLGYSMRTLYAFGIKNVFLNDRDYSNMESQLLKSSAGAYDKLNIRIIKDEVSEIKNLKDKYHVYGLYRGDTSKDIFDETFKQRNIFILGGEKRGISKELLKQCDDFIHISYGSDFRNALNACAALDVVATLLYKQKRK